jgi:hypothetical protein
MCVYVCMYVCNSPTSEGNSSSPSLEIPCTLQNWCSKQPDTGLYPQPDEFIPILLL